MTYKISYSQFKKYLTNPSERAGSYALGIWSNFSFDGAIAGKMFHEFVAKQYMTPEEIIVFDTQKKERIVKGYESEPTESAIEKYNIIVMNYNASPYKDQFTDGIFAEKEITFDFQNVSCKAIVDRICKFQGRDVLVDYKCITNFTKVGDYGRTMMSALGSYGEYELQAWFYFNATGYDECIFFEIRNAEFKKDTPADRSQLLIIKATPEWMEEMNKKYIPLLQDMINLRIKLESRILPDPDKNILAPTIPIDEGNE